jgi:hypothetical protein
MAHITPVNLWLNCLSAESSGVIRLDESKEFRSVRINDVLKGLENYKRDESADLDDWIDEFHDLPIILLLPTGKGKLTPFHHIIRDKQNKTWVGLSGLGGVSTPWRSVKPSEAGKALTSDKLAKEVASTILPTLKQFLHCSRETIEASAAALEALVGESDR